MPEKSNDEMTLAQRRQALHAVLAREYGEPEATRMLDIIDQTIHATTASLHRQLKELFRGKD